VCALLVAVTGLFAVLMQAMTERRREIGIRMAIGAARSDIAGLVVRDGLVLAGAGVAIGGAAAYLGLHAQVLTLAGTAGAVLVAALFAAALPAMRAVAVNPIETLRHE
jgi:ABC-type antimicrobial peptide transport system permease subunit